MRVLILVLAAIFVVPGASVAHPGGLAADGCHNDRKNGGRHCHGGGSSRPPPSDRARSGAFANCAAARAAGAAPVRIGEPGYGRHLDRDGDGVGCER